MKRLVVCALLVGCGGDDSGGGGGSPVAIENLGMELGNSSCAKIFQCCTDPEIMKQFMGITVMGQPITTEDQCVSFTAGFFNGLALPQWQASIAAGRMEYDASAAGGCVAYMNSLSCSDYAGLESGANTSLAGTCRPFLIPKVANDGACMHDNECISDNCVGESSSADGACKPIPALGEACSSNCADGSYCGYDSQSSQEKCLALEANGTQCGQNGECMSDYCDTTMPTHVCGTKARTCDGR